MSHIARCTLAFKHVDCVERAANALGFAVTRNATVRLSGLLDRRGEAEQTFTGTVVHPTGWKYPIVIDAQGTATYDDYVHKSVAWGDQTLLGKFKQRYAVEVGKRRARLDGYACRETTLPDGTVRLVLETQ